MITDRLSKKTRRALAVSRPPPPLLLIRLAASYRLFISRAGGERAFFSCLNPEHKTDYLPDNLFCSRWPDSPWIHCPCVVFSCVRATPGTDCFSCQEFEHRETDVGGSGDKVRFRSLVQACIRKFVRGFTKEMKRKKEADSEGQCCCWRQLPTCVTHKQTIQSQRGKKKRQSRANWSRTHN